MPPILAYVDRAARALEESPVSPGRWCLAFGAIVATRNLLEVAVGQNPVYFPLQFFVHYPLAYVAPMLALVLVLHLFSGTPVRRVTNLMLYVWSLTLLPPLVDLLLGRGSEGIGYLRLQGTEPLEIFLRFFDPRVSFAGTTAGIRVEAAVACLLGAGYVGLRRRRPAWPVLVRAGGAALAVYVTALGFFTLPHLVARSLAPFLAGGDPSAIFAPGTVVPVPPPVDVRVGDRVAIAYLVPLCLVLGLVWLWRSDPSAPGRLFRALPRIGALRAAVLTGAGVTYGGLARARLEGGPLQPAPVDLLAAAAVVLAAPLVVAGARLLTDARAVAPGLVMIAGGLCLACAAGATAPTLLAVVLALIWIRRRPPLDLDRLWLLGPLALALQGLALVGAGAGWGLQQDALAALAPPLQRGVLLTLVLAGLGTQLVRERLRVRPELPWDGRSREIAAVAAWLTAAVVLPLAVGSGWILPLLAAGTVLAATVPRLLGHAVAGLEGAGLVAALFLALAGSLSAPAAREALVESGTRRPKLIVRRAMRLETEGRPEAAAAVYRQALELDPDLPRVWTRVGEIARRAGDPETARRAFERARELDPLDVPSRQQLGMILLEQGLVEEAVAVLDEAARLAPEHPVVALSLAEALTRLDGARERAVAAWQRYLAVSEGVPGEEPFRVRARAALVELRAGD